MQMRFPIYSFFSRSRRRASSSRTRCASASFDCIRSWIRRLTVWLYEFCCSITGRVNHLRKRWKIALRESTIQRPSTGRGETAIGSCTYSRAESSASLWRASSEPEIVATSAWRWRTPARRRSRTSSTRSGWVSGSIGLVSAEVEKDSQVSRVRVPGPSTRGDDAIAHGQGEAVDVFRALRNQAEPARGLFQSQGDRRSVALALAVEPHQHALRAALQGQLVALR